MFSAGYELWDIFVKSNLTAFSVCFFISAFFIVVMATDWGYYNGDIVGKLIVGFSILGVVFIINLMIPVHYDYVGTTKANSKQITKISDYGEGKKYTLKNGTSYVVYSTDTSHNYAQQKQTTYVFKRFQAKVPPIRRLFNDRAVPERVKLEITKTLK